MRITNYQPTYNIYLNSGANKSNSAPQHDCVSFQSKFFNPFETLEKLNYFTTSEYNKLFFCEKYTLREGFKEMLRTNSGASKIEGDITLHEDVVKEAKKSLDERFGEGNYVVVTVGRSLSSIGKVLSYIIGDESVKQVPMSRRCLFNMHQGSVSRASKEDINTFNEYLSSIGLTKEAVEKSGKKFIITDYCCTGKSLDASTQFLKNYQLLGNSENIIPVDFSELITNENLKWRLDCVLLEHGLKDYSFVESLRELSSVKEKAENPAAKHTLGEKLTWFTLLDRQMTGKAH